MPLPNVQFFPTHTHESITTVAEKADRIVVTDATDLETLPKVPTIVIDPSKRKEFNELVSFFCGLKSGVEIWSDNADAIEGVEYKFVSHSRYLQNFDCILDPEIILEIHKMKDAKSVLVNGDYWDSLLNIMHLSDTTHNMTVKTWTKDFGWQRFLSLPPTTQVVRAQSCSIDHPRVIPIPSSSLRQQPHNEEKSILCYYVPMMPPDPCCQAASRNCTAAIKTKDWIQIEQGNEYVDTLKKAKFVICPPITGLDSPIFWEAKAHDTVPIVLQSPMAQMYKQFGCVVVNSWDDITKEFLEGL